MPGIKQVEREKEFLKAVFNFCGIEGVTFEARRLNANILLSAQEMWEHSVATRGKDQVLNVAEFFSDEFVLDAPLVNYLYLTPNRPLLQEEWDKAQPALTAILANNSVESAFKSGVRVYVGKKAIDVKTPDEGEDSSAVNNILRNMPLCRTPLGSIEID